MNSGLGSVTVVLPNGGKQADDKQRLDWLEQFYSDTAREPGTWREFMVQVTEVGFRDAIDRTSGVKGK